jgi:hypothetical protein
VGGDGVGEQQVPGPDQGGGEHVDVGVGGDAAQVALGGPVNLDDPSCSPLIERAGLPRCVA